MIDMRKLREISQGDLELNGIVMQEPMQLTEKEFLAKFSLLWNLPGKKNRTKGGRS